MSSQHEIPYQSLPGLLRKQAGSNRSRPALRYKREGKYISLSYAEYYLRALMVARGLRRLGVEPGDRIAILSENCPGWVIADMGILTARAVTVPVYPTNTQEQVEYVLNHATCRVVFVSSQQQYQKLLGIRERIPSVETVVAYERFIGQRELPVIHLYQLSELSHPVTPEEQAALEHEIDAIVPSDLLSIIYTSGTTGRPKGVMLDHANILADAWCGLKKLNGLERRETFLSFLPLSHILERTAGYYAVLMTGSEIAFAESVDKVVENIVEVRPTAMVSVPRLFEKNYSRIYENAHQLSPLKRRLFHAAIAVGRDYVHVRYVKRQPIGLLGLKYKLFDKLVFRKIRARFGGQLRFFISGGAPLDKTINEFMWIIGIPTFEGYGLTETSPAVTLSCLEEIRFGSVGRVLERTEAKLLDDGELLVRGPQVMQGYYQDEQAIAEAFCDGWLKTGDVARIDAEGYVYIVDRKKKLIVTAGGKNIAPQPLENELKLDKFISQAFVYGDRRPYLVAFVTPNLDRLIELGQEQQLYYLDIEELVANEKVKGLFNERIAQLNSKLPPYETIKKFVLLPRDFSIEGGELTPTLKLRRKVIYEKFRERIESLYESDHQSAEPALATSNGGTA